MVNLRFGSCGLLLLVFLAGCRSGRDTVINGYQYTVEKEATYKNAAVVSAHPLASKAGMLVMKAGGNAVDGAIAVQLALAVVYPGAGNIGGGGFMVAHLADGKQLAIDFRETAPAKAFRDMYLDSGGNPLMEKSQLGHLAAGVPGTVAGLFSAHTYARLPFSELIQPAIDLASNGFSITEAEARQLNEAREEFITANTSLPVYVKNSPWKAGDTLIQKDLAETLIRIRDNGAAGFYEGKTAGLIIAEMKRGNGLIAPDDLKNYKAIERTPVVFNYKEHTIVTMPLPASGGILLPQMMKMAELFPLKSYGFQTPKTVQLMTEIERLAYADRAEFLGDPDFYKIPVNQLIADEYIRSRTALIPQDSAGKSETTRHGQPKIEKEETTHLCVTDKDGNAVAVTTTLNGSFGSKTVVAGAGFLLNNEMDDFSVKPGVPNMYGAVGAEANAIEPGKRMLSSMTPTLVLKNNKPVIITGTPGGTTIITSVFQTLLNLLEFGLTPDQAVNLPKFHHQWLPDEVFLENNFPEETTTALKKMGYKIAFRGAIGRTELIVIDKAGNLIAVGDKRGDDAVSGF